MGNLYQSPDKTDREYGLGGRLERRGSWRYKYDEDGHLIEKYKGSGGFFGSKKEHWRYHWDSFGMLREVHRPDGDKVRMTYDALGRRLSKKYKNTTTKWLWSGNTPLHEWKESRERKFKDGEDYLTTREHSHTMWVFEDNSFVPCAKIKNGKTYSIITDHLGTPTQMYNDEGESVWEQELDIYGNVRKFANKDYVHLPFRYQGQYYDREIDLCYNRFRYYDTELGRYISEDPIGFASGEFNFYNYVGDTNNYTDSFGLAKKGHYGPHRLEPEKKYLGGKEHGIKQQKSDAVKRAKKGIEKRGVKGTPQGKWGSKKDLDYAGEKAATLKPGEMKDFPINEGSSSIVYYADGTESKPDMIRVRNNGDGTFHGFPIDSSTAEPIFK